MFTRAAGVSPPWLDKHDGARSATIVGERTLCTSAARCQPAVGSETSSKWRAVFLNKNAACQPAMETKRTCSGARSRPDENACVPREAYTPRSWRHARCPVTGQITPFAMHKRTFARAAGVSPPWCVARTVADQNRTMLAVSRTHNQERRASARRGLGNLLQLARSFFPTRIAKVSLPWERNGVAVPRILARETACVPREAYTPRSWLHVRHVACGVRFRFATTDVSHGRLTPPALVRKMGELFMRGVCKL
jgi:hypothetical protein